MFNTINTIFDKNTKNHNDNDSTAHWALIESYFSKEHLQQLVRHQLESYNDFITRQIPETINMFNPATIVSEHDFDKKSGKYALEISITFENFGIYRPQIHENNGATKLMFPQEARLRNFTYASSMTVNMNIKYIIRTGEMLENIQTIYKVLPKIHIGKIPIMLRSSVCVLTHYKHMPAEITGECKMDPGGYFIINGSEKTCLGQERAAENMVFCFNITKNNSKWSYIAEIKSVPDWKCISPKQISIMMSQKSNSYGYSMWIQIPRLKQPIPLVIAFRALGIISDKEICQKIVLDIDSPNNQLFLENIKATLVEANTCMTQEAAIKYITSQVIYTPLNMDKETGQAKKREFALEVLNNDLFPHCHNKVQQVYFLGYMTLRLLKCYNAMIPPDDRDSYTNKRIDLTGILLNNLFRNYLNKLVKDMQKQVVREINNGSWRSTEDFGNIINLTNIYKIVKSTTIENGFKRALATGDFGIKQTNSNKVGVAQVLNRLTYVSSLSHLRRCNTPIDKSGKLIPPRKLHNSTWGFLCPAETPEGASVGVVKNISYLATITIASSTLPIREYLSTQIIALDQEPNLYNYVKVIVNGAWIGITKDPINLYNSLKEKKHKGIINVYTSVVFNYKTKEIIVCNDAGRLIRPVLKVQNNKILVSDEIIKRVRTGELEWEDLLTDCKTDESIIEYIDPMEQSWSMIAMNNKELNLYNPNIIRKYTHREIHPSTIFGILASCIPFPEHNQAPRLTYQCLGVNETVWMADGRKLKITDVKIGDKVLTFHPETLDVTETKVVNQFVRKNEYPIYELTTISGRDIIATGDHKFMTDCGWKTVDEMRENPEIRVGITMTDYTINIIPEQNHKKEQKEAVSSILSEDGFIEKMRELEVDETDNRKVSKIFKYVNALKGINMLPLNTNNKNLAVLSRMIGFLYADGTINVYQKNRDGKYKYKEFQCAFDFGVENDAIQFQKDVARCGFKTVKILEGTRTFVSSHDPTMRKQTHHTFSCTYNGCFPAFLISLGISFGKKTEHNRSQISDWIMNTPEYSRQFLKGFQGGDGCKIRYDKNSLSIRIAHTSQQINPLYEKSLAYFMAQCVTILKSFDIEVTNEIKSELVQEDRTRISYNISSKNINLVNYFEKIGYAYAETKNNVSFINVEYLKMKIKYLADNKLTALKKITDFISVDKFNENIIIKNNCMFQPIKSIVLQPDGMIADIEVESENHSFIAGKNYKSKNCAMGKQAMGIYVTNYDTRMDKTAYVHTYGMRPLVDTRLMNMIDLHKIPSGAQVVVAIMTYTGYNQEDSILFNKGSIERGLFQATIYHTEKDEDKKIHGDQEIRCRPDPSKTKSMKFGNYDKVAENGVIPENEIVANRDIIIAKVLPIKENRNNHSKVIKFEDQSRIYRTKEETYIDKNYIERNGDGYNFAKVRLRTLRQPVIGDKFSCYTPDHDILTSIGWINIANINKNHKVATLGALNTLIYQYPEEVMLYDCDEDVYELNTSQISLKVTKNHRMWVGNRDGTNFKIKTAEECYGKRCCYMKNCENWSPDFSGKYPEQLKLNDTKTEATHFLIYNEKKEIVHELEINAWIKFFGIWIAEGCAYKTNKNCYIDVSAHKDRVKVALDEVANVLEWKWSKCDDTKKNGNTHINARYRIFNKYIVNYMCPHSVGAINKSLPEWVWYLSKEQCLLFLESMELGDGHIMKNGTPRYDTSSVKLADDYQRLCLQAGFSANLYLKSEAGHESYCEPRDEIFKQTVDAWRLTRVTVQNSPLVNKNIKAKSGENRLDEYIHYTGKVYCCKVGGEGIIYVKRNGKPSWCGNSRHKRLCRKASCSNNLGSYSRKNSCAPKYIVY